MREDSKRELEELREQNNGRLLASDVVEFARSTPSSSLHKEFDWTLETAAMAHWLDVARRMIRVIVTTVRKPATKIDANVSTRQYPIPKYHSLPADRAAGGGYTEINDVLEAPERRHQLLFGVLIELERIQKRNSALPELCDCPVLDDVFETISRFREYVDNALQEPKAKPKRSTKKKAAHVGASP